MDQQNVGSKRSASGGSNKIAAKSYEAAEHWKETVADKATQARDQARSAKDQTGTRIRGVAMQLRNVGNSLREDDPMVAQLADRASRGVEGIADYVSSSSLQSVVRDAERLARRQPALFFGGAMLLGLAVGRFLKSSAPQAMTAGDNEGEGGPLARRQERESGFFPSNERDLGSSQRYRENYDATFARGSDENDPARRETTAPEGSERGGTETPGRAAGRGERS